MNNSGEYDLQLAMLASLSPNYYESIGKITIDQELNLFRNELTDSAKKLNKIRISQLDTNYNIQFLSDKKLMDVISHILKYLPLRAMIWMRAVCKIFLSNIDKPINIIFIDDMLIDKILPFKISIQNKLFNSIYNNIKTIKFKVPEIYPKNNFELIRINPPNLSKIIIEIEYMHQLNFLLELDFNKIHIIIKCCSDKEKCTLCTYNLIREHIKLLEKTKLDGLYQFNTIYHNNKRMA